MPTHVRRLERADDRLSGEPTRVERLTEGDFVLFVAGEIVPCNGVVIEASAGTVIGSVMDAGTTVLSNLVIVRVGAAQAAMDGRRPDPRALRVRRRRRAAPPARGA